MAGGNITHPPSSMTYASVVSLESVRINLLVYALNGIVILSGDTHNKYLNAETKHKTFFYTGDEWKYDQGKVVVFLRYLYGLKSSALARNNYLEDLLGNYMGFTSFITNPDIWFNSSTEKYINQYYTYILVYVDDIIIMDR